MTDMEKYVETLQILPKIAGIYEDVLKEYVANRKFHFFWFRWRQRYRFEKWEQKSLEMFSKYLNSLAPKVDTKPGDNETTQNNKANTQSKLEDYFLNIANELKTENKAVETPKTEVKQAPTTTKQNTN